MALHDRKWSSWAQRCFTIYLLAWAIATSPLAADDKIREPCGEQPAAAELNAQSNAQEVADSEDQDALYRKFSETLNNSVLVGQFAIDGVDGELKKERYEIKKVTKIGKGDQWMFLARIKYGDHDLTVPMPLHVKWAGRTPVITLDALTIPGLGTFDARVVIDGKRYAGTWQHGDVGGHLFGKVLPAEDDAAQAQ